MLASSAPAPAPPVQCHSLGLALSPGGSNIQQKPACRCDGRACTVPRSNNPTSNLKPAEPYQAAQSLPPAPHRSTHVRSMISGTLRLAALAAGIAFSTPEPALLGPGASRLARRTPSGAASGRCRAARRCDGAAAAEEEAAPGILLARSASPTALSEGSGERRRASGTQ